MGINRPRAAVNPPVVDHNGETTEQRQIRVTRERREEQTRGYEEYRPQLEVLKAQIGAMFPRCQWKTEEFNADSYRYTGKAELQISCDANLRNFVNPKTILVIQRDERVGATWTPLVYFPKGSNSGGYPEGRGYVKRMDGTYNLGLIQAKARPREDRAWQSLAHREEQNRQRLRRKEEKREELGGVHDLPRPSFLSGNGYHSHRRGEEDHIGNAVVRKHQSTGGLYTFNLKDISAELARAVLTLITRTPEEEGE